MKKPSFKKNIHQEINRKIELPEYCHPLTGGSYGRNQNCNHDYPPESKDEHDEYVCWTCSKCGMKRCYDVYD